MGGGHDPDADVTIPDPSPAALATDPTVGDPAAARQKAQAMVNAEANQQAQAAAKQLEANEELKLEAQEAAKAEVPDAKSPFVPSPKPIAQPPFEEGDVAMAGGDEVRVAAIHADEGMAEVVGNSGKPKEVPLGSLMPVEADSDLIMPLPASPNMLLPIVVIAPPFPPILNPGGLLAQAAMDIGEEYESLFAPAAPFEKPLAILYAFTVLMRTQPEVLYQGAGMRCHCFCPVAQSVHLNADDCAALYKLRNDEQAMHDRISDARSAVANVEMIYARLEGQAKKAADRAATVPPMVWP